MSNEQGPLTFWNDLLSQCGNPQGDRQAHLVCPQRIPAAAAGLSSQPPTPQACLHSWPWASSPSLKPQKARTRVASSLSHPGSIISTGHLPSSPCPAPRCLMLLFLPPGAQCASAALSLAGFRFLRLVEDSVVGLWRDCWCGHCICETKPSICALPHPVLLLPSVPHCKPMLSCFPYELPSWSHYSPLLPLQMTLQMADSKVAPLFPLGQSGNSLPNPGLSLCLLFGG